MFLQYHICTSQILTLPVRMSLFFRDLNIDMSLCRIYGVVNGIHIEPRIHQNVFQPELLLVVLPTCFILSIKCFVLLLLNIHQSYWLAHNKKQHKN